MSIGGHSRPDRACGGGPVSEPSRKRAVPGGYIPRRDAGQAPRFFGCEAPPDPDSPMRSTARADTPEDKSSSLNDDDTIGIETRYSDHRDLPVHFGSRFGCSRVWRDESGGSLAPDKIT